MFLIKDTPQKCYEIIKVFTKTNQPNEELTVKGMQLMQLKNDNLMTQLWFLEHSPHQITVYSNLQVVDNKKKRWQLQLTYY